MNYSDKLNWGKILAIKIYDIKHKNFVDKLVTTFKFLIKVLLTRLDEYEGNNSVEILFFKSLDRNDYNTLFEVVRKTYPYNDYSVYQSNYNYSVQFNISLFLIAVQISKQFNLSLIEKIYIISNIVKCLKLIRIIKKINIKYLVVFSDMQMLDNLMVQYFGNKCVATITLQHALYKEYTESNINIYNYKNVVSNYFLAWGESTKNLIEKYNKNSTQVVICGKPIYPSYYNINTTKPDISYFILILDYDEYYEENSRLINIAHEVANILRMKYNIRFHPKSNKTIYTLPGHSNLVSKQMPLAYSSFFLGHNSSLIFELLALGHHVLKLESSHSSFQISESFIISSADDVVKKIKNGREINSNRYIKYVGAESCQKYKEFFKKLRN